MTTRSWRSLAVAAVLFTGMALPASAVTITCPGACGNFTLNTGDVGANPTSVTGQFDSGVSTAGFFFTDYVTFNLTGISPVFITTSSTSNPFVRPDLFDQIVGFRTTLFAGTPAVPGAQIGPTVNAVYGANAAVILTPAQLLTAPGSYFFLFEGAGGLFSGFAGVVTATPVPSQVPLPGALTLFGTGLVGLWALRRRRNKQQVAA
jgi:hypothetical protein